MENYNEMYLKMFRAAEQAINILTAAQRECEELYVSSPGPELTVVPPSKEKKTAGAVSSTLPDVKMP